MSDGTVTGGEASDATASGGTASGPQLGGPVAGGVMRCPKCGAEMRTSHRNGVTIEQCRKCYGIFLDRGELEQLIGREISLFGHDDGLRGEGPPS